MRKSRKGAETLELHAERNLAHMPITVTCSCGAALTVDAVQRGRKVFCPRCRIGVEIPLLPEEPAGQAARESGWRLEAAYEGEVFEPRHVEHLSDAQGERWKLTCFCGKRILSPEHSDFPVGRCPKCGRRLRLPGFRSKSPRTKAHVVGASASGTGRPVPPTPGLSETVADLPALDLQAGAGALPVDAQDDIGTIVMEPLELQPLARDTGVNRDAAIETADRLRAHKVATPEQSDPGLISAWPLAGRLSRALAGFIDLTLGTLAVGAVMTLASLKILPEACLHPAVGLAAFLTAGLLNDVLMQLGGGGLGKRMVVLTLRKRGGQPLDASSAVLRGLLKWALMPGWLLAFVDPAQRALHDVICETVVLKGRTR